LNAHGKHIHISRFGILLITGKQVGFVLLGQAGRWEWPGPTMTKSEKLQVGQNLSQQIVYIEERYKTY
jgi:hypothetical protein